MNAWLIAFVVLSMNTLYGHVQDYLKLPAEKTGNHRMDNIDFIYMINLDQRPEKFASCEKQLAPYGIYPYRFSAVNGWELSFEALNNIGVIYEPWMENNNWGTCYFAENGGQPYHEIVHVPGRNYFCHCMALGTIGIVLSHLSVLEDAFNSGYETIWVMEDDIELVKDPHLISDLIAKLDRTVGKKGWDMLFTDQDTKGQNGEYVPCYGYAWRPNFKPKDPSIFAKRKRVSRDFRKIGSRYGTYSFIIRRQGMEKILNFLKQHQVFLPYDMEFYFPDNMRIFTVTDDVVSTQPKALSDNGAPNYLNTEN